MNNKSYDIAIVGAGLVGATLAALVAQSPENQSLSIVLIDQGDAPTLPDLTAQPPQFDPRVVALTHASVSLFKSINSWPQVQSRRCCSYQHMTVWDDEGTGEIQFDAAELQQSALGVIVENSVLLDSVLEKIKQCPQVDLIRHQSIESVEDMNFLDESVDKIVDKKGDGKIDGSNTDSGRQLKKLILSSGETLSAQLVVAADGAQSKIRQLLNIPIRTWSYEHKAIVTTVQCEYEHELTAWQNFLVSGPLAFLPLGDESKQFCSIVWSVENQRADELMELSDNDFKHALGAAFENRLGEIVRVDKRYSFPLVQRHAVDYFLPQVALVGDAAHTIHPLAGQGVNLGLQDAQALAQEVARASKRQLSLVDASILRRYQRKRKRHNLEAMALMESFKRLFGHRNIAVRWLRSSGLKAVGQIKPLKNWLAKKAMGL